MTRSAIIAALVLLAWIATELHLMRTHQSVAGLVGEEIARWKHRNDPVELPAPAEAPTTSNSLLDAHAEDIKKNFGRDLRRQEEAASAASR